MNIKFISLLKYLKSQNSVSLGPMNIGRTLHLHYKIKFEVDDMLTIIKH